MPPRQVHEKHILLPLLPAALLGTRQPTLFAWFATAATFSLYPLLERDGQALPYFLCQLSYLTLTLALDPSPPLPRVLRFGLAASLCGMLALHSLAATISPPARYPDLHAVAFAAYSCAHFVLAYLALLVWQWRCRMVEPPHTPFDAPATAPLNLAGGAAAAHAAGHAKAE